MRILLSGAGGLLGSAFAAAREAEGHEVGRLVRHAASGAGLVKWSPSGGVLDPASLAGWDALVHLAGKSIADPWTRRGRKLIRDSRVVGTRVIAEALAKARPAPRVMVCASAVGYYGSRGEEILDEGSAAGSGFLAEVCRDWEAAARHARDAGIRVAHLRFGVVLSKEGGALAKMLPVFRLGLGGRLGSGRQWLSWVSREDAVEAIRFATVREDLEGPVNVTAPEPVSNREFTRTLARVLGRPAFLPVPAVVLRLLPGGMAGETVLASQRAVPARLTECGFAFRFPELETTLRHATAKTAA